MPKLSGIFSFFWRIWKSVHRIHASSECISHWELEAMIVFSPPVFFSVLEKRRCVLSLTDKSSCPARCWYFVLFLSLPQLIFNVWRCPFSHVFFGQKRKGKKKKGKSGVFLESLMKYEVHIPDSFDFDFVFFVLQTISLGAHCRWYIRYMWWKMWRNLLI